MQPSPHVRVTIDLNRVRQNAARIRQQVGVPVLAVVKADAYGLGIGRVARALADVVDGFCVFSLREAAQAKLWKLTGKPALAIGPPENLDAEAYLEQHVRPAVSTVAEAAALRSARPVLCVDTGMQRFACPAADVQAVVEAGACEEAFTHATRLEHAQRLVESLGGRGLRLHAAGSALLDEPRARLDAVRPGLALYRGAVRVSTRLIEIHDSAGPAGYGGFVTSRHGVILAGYSHGLRPGPCLINGQRRRILEVGMQSAYVEIGPDEQVGDEVILLGDSLTESDVAREWRTTAHEALLHLSRTGRARTATSADS